jgi:signal transduction histidine kinase
MATTMNSSPSSKKKKRLIKKKAFRSTSQGDYQAIIEFTDKIEQLFHFQNKVEISYPIDQIWEVFLDEIKTIISIEICALFLVDEASHEFYLKNALPENQALLCKKEMSYQTEYGVFAWVINRRKPALIPSLAFKNNKTIILLPLSTVRKTLGMVLILTSVKNSSITQESLKLLTLITKQCSLVMENALLYENLKHESESLLKAQAQVHQAEKLASLARLTTGAFHEILNPLNIISNHLQFLLLDKNHPPRIARYLNVMHIQTNRIAKIVKSLLQFCRYPTLEKRELKVNELIDKVVSLFQYGSKLDQIEIIKKFDLTVSDIVGDTDKLSQVFFHLLTNAREAMPNGGTVTISTKASEKNTPPFGKSDFIEITFQDTGCGIPQENLSKIFDPFFTTLSEEGFPGLGLSLSYGIIQDHGGSMRVDSAINQGTTFTICLPIKFSADA